jgi:hypothetical protein
LEGDSPSGGNHEEQTGHGNLRHQVVNQTEDVEDGDALAVVGKPKQVQPLQEDPTNLRKQSNDQHEVGRVVTHVLLVESHIAENSSSKKYSEEAE